MSWWLRARGDRTAWGLALAAAALVPLVGSAAMPVLRLGVGPAPFSLLLPALVAAALVGVVHGGSPLHEALSPRPTALFSVLLVGACLAVAALTWGAAGVLTSQPGLSAVCLRNLAGYAGVGLVASRLAGGLGGNAAPVGYAVVVAVLGTPRDVWAWPLHEASSTVASVVAATLLLAGLSSGLGRGAMRARARRET